MAEIPAAVQDFIGKYIHSLSQLEILLLLRDRFGDKLASADVAKALLMHPPAVEPILESLRRSGLVAVHDISGRRHYQFSPAKHASVIDELEKWYKSHPVSITTLIFSKPIDKIRGFADSFRLRKNEEEEEE